MNELTTQEQQELEQHETTIERGLQAYYEVSKALMSIRDNRVYLETHATFDDYCQDKYGMSAKAMLELIRVGNQ